MSGARAKMEHAKVPLWCRCGTDKTPIPCVGGCGYLCQLLPSKGPRRADGARARKFDVTRGN